FLEFLPKSGRAPGFEGQDIKPMGALANLKDRPAGVEGVASQTEAGLRKIFLQIGRQPAKGLEFTVLFDLFIIAEGRVLARLSILNKFGGERQSQPGRLDQ